MPTVEHYQKEVATIPIDATSVEIAEEMRREQVGSLVVLDGKQPVGIVTDRDLLCRVIAMGRDAESANASDVMSSPLVSVEPATPLEELVDTMAASSIRRLPVVRDGKLRGMVTLDDAMGALSDECADLAEGRRRSTRAASGRRLYYEVETTITDLADHLDRLGGEARRTAERRIEELLDKIGLRG